MSVAVCRGAAVPAFEAPGWRSLADPDRPAQLDIWNAIQADMNKSVTGSKKASTQYVHPLVRRSSSLMSQRSLETCTESLGSETGSGDFSASLDVADMACLFSPQLMPPAAAIEAKVAVQPYSAWNSCSVERWERKELLAVNYHCAGAVRSPRRAFPPPLPSMSRGHGPCLQMRTNRCDGRLVVEAVVVKPRGYLHARRQGGRLRLSFIDCSVREQSTPGNAGAEAPYGTATPDRQEIAATLQEEEEVVMEEFEEEVEEEEVEVVDRGTVVEVKVSTQPQTPTAAKVHRSTLVINKFVGSTPLTVEHRQPPPPDATSEETAPAPAPALRRVPSSTSTTTLAAAVAVASTTAGGAPPPPPGGDDDDECGGLHFADAPTADAKQLLLFTSRRRDKQELLQSLRRCRQLRQKPLFILEPYCIATS